jgi:predicted ATPase
VLHLSLTNPFCLYENTNCEHRDDLQWSDTSSVELIYSLLVHIDQIINEESRLLLIGCYRSDEECPVALKIEEITKGSRVSVANVNLKALSPDDVNSIVSDALCYPRRLTRPLANVITMKTSGNPLFIKEFLNSLAAENLLTYSLSRHKWHWDEELIQVRTVSDNVAKLLTRKLLRLSKHVLSSLSILSCFGSEVLENVLIHVRDACGNPDVIFGLECAAAEGLVEKTKGSYRFSHDMIQKAVDDYIEPNGRQKMLLELAETLLKRTGEDRDDTVLFIISDFVNRVGPNPSFITSAEKRARYAALNLRAAEKAANVPDYNSVCDYVENGINFLGEDNWKPRHYQLSLALFKNAAIGQWALGNTTLMSERINEVCHKARVFEDKLEVLDVLIHSLGMDGASATKSIGHGLSVLKQIGEVFPSPIQNEYIVEELSEWKARLLDTLPTNTEDMSIMGHPLKVQAMKFLHRLLYLTHRQKDKIFPLIACRMVDMTLEFGLHEFSSVGIAGMALSYYTVFADVDTAYQLGKVAVNMAMSQGQSVFPEVIPWVHGCVYVWREPLQALLPPLLESYNIAKSVKPTTALVNAMLYTYRAYFSGSPLEGLHQEMTGFLSKMAQYRRVAVYLLMIPVSNAISAFSGGPARDVWEGIGQCRNDDENLKTAIEHKELTLYECIVALKMMKTFIFRDMDEAQTIVTNCNELLKSFGHGLVVRLATAYRVFYSGLIAFHCFRESQDRCWINIGNSSIAKMESWSHGCKWNFENKLLLLQAESHYALGNMNSAAEKYRQAVESSRQHRFVHEEAIACELASHFHQKMNDQELSNTYMKRSIECYKTWGAHTKAEVLINDQTT